MAYIYDRSPGGDKLSVTRCEEHGGLIVTAHSFSGRLAVPVCIAPGDVAEVLEEMVAWAAAPAGISGHRGDVLNYEHFDCCGQGMVPKAEG